MQSHEAPTILPSGTWLAEHTHRVSRVPRQTIGAALLIIDALSSVLGAPIVMTTAAMRTYFQLCLIHCPEWDLFAHELLTTRPRDTAAKRPPPLDLSFMASAQHIAYDATSCATNLDHTVADTPAPTPVYGPAARCLPRPKPAKPQVPKPKPIPPPIVPRPKPKPRTTYPWEYGGTLSPGERSPASCDPCEPCSEEEGGTPRLVGVEENPGPFHSHRHNRATGPGNARFRGHTAGALIPDFNLHGHYVGPGHSGAMRLGQNNFAVKPIDALDAAAREHDLDYAATSDVNARRLADAKLARAAIDYDPHSAADYLHKHAVRLGMKAKAFWEYLPHTEEAKPALAFKPLYPKVGFGARPALMSEPVEPPAPRLVGVHPDPGPHGWVPMPRNERRGRTGTAAHAERGQPYFPTAMLPTVSEQYVNDLGGRYKKVKIPLGYLNLGNVPEAGSVYAPLNVFQELVIDRGLFEGYDIGKFFDMFERWRIVRASLDFTSDLGSSNNGSFYVHCDPDPTDLVFAQDSLDWTVLQAHAASKSQVFGGFKGHPLVGRNGGKDRKHNLNTDWLWSDPTIVTAAGGNSALSGISVPPIDPHLTTAGVLVFTTGDGIPTTVTDMGEIVLDVWIEFDKEQSTDIGKHIYSYRMCTGNSAQTFTVNTASPASLSTYQFTAASATNLLYQEFSANPRYYNTTAGTFSLPPGEYLFELNMYTTTSTSLTSSTLAFNPSVQWGSYTSKPWNTIAPAETSIEFANPTSAAGQTNISAGWNFGGFARIRVGANDNGNWYTTVTPTMSMTFTGSACHCWGMHFNVIRIPSFTGSPLQGRFPQATANAAVGIRATVKIRQTAALLVTTMTSDPSWKPLWDSLTKLLVDEHWTQANAMAYLRQVKLHSVAPSDAQSALLQALARPLDALVAPTPTVMVVPVVSQQTENLLSKLRTFLPAAEFQRLLMDQDEKTPSAPGSAGVTTTGPYASLMSLLGTTK